MRRLALLCAAIATASVPAASRAGQGYSIVDLTAGSPFAQTAANGISINSSDKLAAEGEGPGSAAFYYSLEVLDLAGRR